MPAKKTPVDLTCKVCGCDYSVQPHRAERSKCCSRDCAQRYAAQFGAEYRKTWVRGTGTKHPYVKENGRHQHRVVAERMLGRELLPGEVVHHKDGNGKNNSPSNLQVTNQSTHVKIHWPSMMIARKRKAGY